MTRAGAAAARGPEAAPFYAEVAEASQGAHAFWIEARDGVRLRAALLSEGPEGTVLLFHGRTEYAEKYGAVARWLGGRGFSVLTVDWRGQGLSARLLPDVAVGHVVAFADYQADVAALLDAADSMGLPGPRHLLAHSMGGAIGLRALMEGLPVASAAFSAPMWGILMSAGLRPVARALGRASRPLGLAERYAPGTGPAPASVAFERNVLTGDRGTYERMRGQVAAHPELALGGPSLRWLHEALVEEVALARRPSPAVPCLCAVGSLEAVVSASVIRDRMSRWPTGRLVEVEGARHEILMETPDLREPFLESIAALFHTSS